MGKQHYVCEIKLESKSYFLIWIEGDIDGVALDESGSLQIFYSEEKAMRSPLEPEPSSKSAVYDFDRLKKWLNSPTKIDLDCKLILNAWNLFEDIARSTGDTSFDKINEGTKKIYEKLFYGNNLPAVTPKGKYYEPQWSKEEIQKIFSVLSVGFDLLRRKSNI